jgi:hypothetical protein
VRGLRLLIVPLAVLSLMIGGLMLLSGDQTALPFYDGGQILKTWGLAAGIGAGLLLSVQLTVSGVLAACIVIMLCATLSLCKRAGVMPYVGAAMQVVLQVGLVGLGFVVGDWSGYSGYTSEALAVVLRCGALIALLTALALYLARRLDWVRLALGFAFPLALAFIGFLVGMAEGAGDVDMGLVAPWPLEAWAVMSPVHLWDTLSNWPDMSKLPLVVLAQVWHWIIMVAIQLVLVAMMAEFARDAIRRRKWGMG